MFVIVHRILSFEFVGVIEKINEYAEIKIKSLPQFTFMNIANDVDVQHIT